ncbi:E3 ubiquitin-protein ligase KEG [Diospyros lotus]|uniref:E3 ubiquitin-protein ligase KEG n=1 Tax=Diospyros lotus TaxID=55363 RepID=UPI00224F32A6|nr:E3 ubiquitin-protein ligase KEG [Diospyros lotus]XP_052210583.1 E3 ubiquitin-protein ligase KEG [Diospyros lotus]XP_052210584.1 E3 ubiquitin-protein ligase KEG [Diospyros lotus]XP_052210585.1 E3 ubiquitin-protein ligase KEG [Diospyros lotus]XP_052210586.1 E3 ubiquitin-protein ligase KEG [Diospyros lotus]XP_052210587.1 E3 ubiquitin-protein ligase KEG [Diospyros lotus]
MAGKVVASRPTASFEFELVEGDSGQQNQISPWIDPATIKLRHRIGRGPFGDVWLATLHQTTEDYDEYHEVAVKMLHAIKEDSINLVLEKFNVMFSKCQGLKDVCWLHGISIINGKICIVMKFYEGSVDDKMAHLKGSRLSLPDILRYGIDLAQGTMELHSKDIIVLNLKPSNFLLNENDGAVLGDFGISFLLLGVSLLSSDLVRRLGTPNYMAPEQWQPEVRGPISFETDSWGFGCSILEMFTGIKPWLGKSVGEIFNLVVKKQEKPRIPGGLPPAVENVLIGCFEYDLRSRPVMADILKAFRSSQKAVFREGGWTGLTTRTITEKSSGNGYTKWFLSKDQFQVGDMVRSRKPLNSCNIENMDIPEGIIVGLECDTDQSGFVLVRVHGVHDPIRVHGSSLERVTFGLASGDWVRVKEEDKKHSPVGILHSIQRDGSVAVGFIGRETLWKGNSSELQMAEPYCKGQFVRLKSNVFSPRFEWPRKQGGEWAAGRICQVLPNGCLLVKFPGRLTFGDESSSYLADPAEVEVVSFSTCPDIIKKYQHLEDFHWSVRPLLIAMGLFTALKLGHFVGKKIGRSKVRKQPSTVVPSDGAYMDGQASAAWLPPKVANIFREGVGAATTR